MYSAYSMYHIYYVLLEAKFGDLNGRATENIEDMFVQLGHVSLSTRSGSVATTNHLSCTLFVSIANQWYKYAISQCSKQ